MRETGLTLLFFQSIDLETTIFEINTGILEHTWSLSVVMPVQ